MKWENDKWKEENDKKKEVAPVKQQWAPLPDLKKKDNAGQLMGSKRTVSER